MSPFIDTEQKHRSDKTDAALHRFRATAPRVSKHNDRHFNLTRVHLKTKKRSLAGQVEATYRGLKPCRETLRTFCAFELCCPATKHEEHYRVQQLEYFRKGLRELFVVGLVLGIAYASAMVKRRDQLRRLLPQT